MPTNNGGARRLIFVNNTKTNLENKYVSGSGVGSRNTSVRRALKRKATSQAGTLGTNNTLNVKCPCPCRPTELSYNPSNLAFPYNIYRRKTCPEPEPEPEPDP